MLRETPPMTARGYAPSGAHVVYVTPEHFGEDGFPADYVIAGPEWEPLLTLRGWYSAKHVLLRDILDMDYYPVARRPPEDNRNFAWSPDGRKLAYRSGPLEVSVYDLDRGTTTAVRIPARQVLAWAGAGALLLTAGDEPKGPYAAAFYDLATARQTPLLYLDGRPFLTSPNGRVAAFTLGPAEPDAGKVALLDLPGGALHPQPPQQPCPLPDHYAASPVAFAADGTSLT